MVVRPPGPSKVADEVPPPTVRVPALMFTVPAPFRVVIEPPAVSASEPGLVRFSSLMLARRVIVVAPAPDRMPVSVPAPSMFSVPSFATLPRFASCWKVRVPVAATVTSPVRVAFCWKFRLLPAFTVVAPV